MNQMPLFQPPPPSPAAVDVHAVSLPARTFTGDFYFVRRDGDRLWFAVGDVAGKGLPASVFMAMVQEELEHRIVSCARSGCDPSTTMMRLHQFLRPVLPRNKFVTGVIGWLRDDGVVTLANAGHCPPLVVRASGAIEPIGSTGPVAGVLPRARWTSTTFTLGAGEMLLLYSDGVIESPSASGEEFGGAGIERALARVAWHAPSREVGDAIVADVERHSDGRREDDLTLLVMRTPHRPAAGLRADSIPSARRAAPFPARPASRPAA